MADDKERGSTLDSTERVDPKESLTPEEIEALEAKNGLLQYDKMVEILEAARRAKKSFRLRASTLLALQEVAVTGLEAFPGTFRKHPIGISGTQHVPPPASHCLGLIEEMCDYVNENWDTATPVHLSAYVMWRLNWIHPFDDGNGRTSRIISYLVLCAKLGYLLPGVRTIPERIAAGKQPYYLALDAADAACKLGKLDVSEMEKLLAAHLASQLVEVHGTALGKSAQ